MRLCKFKYMCMLLCISVVMFLLPASHNLNILNLSMGISMMKHFCYARKSVDSSSKKFFFWSIC